ncbi:MAG: hypothetical protein KBS34_03620, partial [Phascolarctobacterium sp.]|nr:hypothetical protein [Candidatus Phascolarctobacterium equi]
MIKMDGYKSGFSGDDVVALLKKVRDLSPEDIESRIKLLENGGFQLSEPFLLKEIEDWLDNHPEATTTVQDGSLSEEKFNDDLKKKTINNYLTPEMYGAIGDGKHDDTDAFEKLLEKAGRIIHLSDGKKYKISRTLTLRAYTKIYGNASLICDGAYLFDMDGQWNIALEGITIDGNKNNICFKSSQSYWRNASFVNITIQNFDTVFDGFRCYYLSAVNCQFYGRIIGKIYGGDSNLTNCFFGITGNASSDVGLQLYGFSFSRFVGYWFDGSVNPLTSPSLVSMRSSTGLIFTDCVFDYSGGHAVLLEDSGQCEVSLDRCTLRGIASSGDAKGW